MAALSLLRFASSRMNQLGTRPNHCGVSSSGGLSAEQQIAGDTHPNEGSHAQVLTVENIFARMSV